MCFSATASFTASAFLVPVGIFCVKKVYEVDKRYLTLAAVPFLFGLQQAFEGGLWLALENSAAGKVSKMAMGFLFFADFIWPLFVPLASAMIEENRRKRQLFLCCAALGGAFGLSILIPLSMQPEWLSITIVRDSIRYQMVQIYDAILPQTGARMVYALIIAVPLLFSSIARIRWLGILLLTTILASSLFFSYAFVSVWCFFAAIISLYILSIINHVEPELKQ